MEILESDIKGNELVIEAVIQSLKDGICTFSQQHCMHPFELPSGEKVRTGVIITYYSQYCKFDVDEITRICEQIRKVHPRGFKEISRSLDLWVERILAKPNFIEEKNQWNISSWKIKPGVDKSLIDPLFIEFTCYVAVCHIKYGASYETITANRFFKLVEDLGFDNVMHLKSKGTGTLPNDVVAYNDADLICKANDVFATIDINIKTECEEAYSKALRFLNNLVQHNFPKSYAIKFKSKEKNFLPVKGIPKKSVNTFFSNAVKYPALYNDMKAYALLVMNKYEWYTDIDDQQCMMPSSFAVFALGLASDQYFDLVRKYFETCDEEHAEVQTKFVPCFVEKCGITEKSLPVIVAGFLSYQSTIHNKIYANAFANKDALALLLDLKQHPEKYSLNVSGFQHIWEVIIYCIFGHDQVKVIKSFPKDCQDLIDEIWIKL